MERIVRCVNCLFYDNIASGKCEIKNKKITYPYADRECFHYANKERKNDVQRDHNKGT